MRTISTLLTMKKPRGVLNLEMAALEKAEQQIDQFIEKRAREKADANKVEELWAESDRRHRDRRREENREAWREYERHLERVHMELALEHSKFLWWSMYRGILPLLLPPAFPGGVFASIRTSSKIGEESIAFSCTGGA
jgi:hypothetical protein